MSDHFPNHIRTLRSRYEEALERLGADGVLIHSGTDHFYHADDQTVPFRAYGHFCHWVPVDRPDQLLFFRQGERPVYFQVISQDYWHDQEIEVAPWWGSEFDIERLSATALAAERVGSPTGLTYLGPDAGFAATLGIASDRINPAGLIDRLDYHRARKTPYEVDRIAAANRLALQGHAAARESFLAGGCEYDIHMAYLAACGILERECPYESIVALNEKAAILHYQHKRRRHQVPDDYPNHTLLIDAGCRVNGYCSDITRTTASQDAHPVFRSLVESMERAHLALVSTVRAGLPYPELHLRALDLLGGILQDHGLVKGTAEILAEHGIASLFMPHGVGHLLGIQVHDVGGHLADADSGLRPPPEAYPYLRNTRVMERDMVFTVEPGLYFIPMLLNPERNSDRGRLINWQLVDELLPLGGIRIEDNVLVTAEGAENLTRGNGGY